MGASCTTILFGADNDDVHQDAESSKSRNKQTANKKSGVVRSSDYKFAAGEELINLRQDLESLKHNLEWAEALKDEKRVFSLQKAIKNGEKRDPDLMYTKALQLMAEAKKMKEVAEEEKEDFVSKWAKVAASARKSLQQFNMEGLWVGK